MGVLQRNLLAIKMVCRIVLLNMYFFTHPFTENNAETRNTKLMNDDHSQSSDVSQASQSNDDGRFKITVMSPYDGEQAEFFTRATHTIEKVLNGACRKFNIDVLATRRVFSLSLLYVAFVLIEVLQSTTRADH